jgi:alpha-L-glutamate ligase-like protein
MIEVFKNYKKIMGLNARNLDYILKKKSLPLIKVANNKLKVKTILEKAGLPVPLNYYIIKNKQEFKKFSWQLPKSFVLKPNQGLGGEGILIVYGKKKDAPIWIKAGQKLVNLEKIKYHVFSILEGNFSTEEYGDVAFFEERVKLHPAFKPYTFKGGIPDIRVLVYEKIPIMAELRLPTKGSEGRSNLHLGGIGVGIDMKTGITTSAIQHNRLIEVVPMSRLVLSGIKIPYWKEVLNIAGLAQKHIGIDLLGIDIALDREKGPVIFEVNARPGISIQLANQAPLRERLERIENLNIKTVRRGRRIAQELFGGEVEEELEEISGRKIIGIFEPVKIILPDKKEIKIMAKIDTGAYRTSINEKLINKLNLKETKRIIKFVSSLGEEKRRLAKIKFELANQIIETEVSIADRSNVKYEMIIGRRDLKKFLLDPLHKTISVLEK